MDAGSYHTAISSPKNVPINEVLLLDGGVTLPRLHIYGTLLVEFYLFLFHNYFTANPKY